MYAVVVVVVVQRVTSRRSTCWVWHPQSGGCQECDRYIHAVLTPPTPGNSDAAPRSRRPPSERAHTCICTHPTKKARKKQRRKKNNKVPSARDTHTHSLTLTLTQKMNAKWREEQADENDQKQRMKLGRSLCQGKKKQLEWETVESG